MIDKLIGPVTDLLDKFVADKDTKIQLAHDLATMAERHAQELAKGQLQVNKQEAAHKSMFVAGWRPAVGWVCVLGLASNFVLAPYFPAVVPMDMSTMMPLLFGMLGLGAARTYEKVNGVAREK